MLLLLNWICDVHSCLLFMINFEQLFSDAALCLIIMEVLCDLTGRYDGAYFLYHTVLLHRNAEIDILRRGRNCLSSSMEEKLCKSF